MSFIICIYVTGFIVMFLNDLSFDIMYHEKKSIVRYFFEVVVSSGFWFIVVFINISISLQRNKKGYSSYILTEKQLKEGCKQW